MEIPVIPHSKEREQAVLAAILMDSKLIHEAMAHLKDKDFFVHSHRHIWQAMKNLYERDIMVEPLSLSDELYRMQKLDEIGGLAYIAEMTDGCIRPVSLQQHIKSLKPFTGSRNAIAAGNRLRDIGLDETLTTEQKTQKCQEIITKLNEESIPTKFESVIDLADEELCRLESIQSGLVGIPVGYNRLDHITCGFQEDQFIILGARPSVGKSAIGVAMGCAAAFSGYKVGIFSLEMSKRDIVTRILCNIGSVNIHKARGGYLNPQEKERLYKAKQKLYSTEIYIDDSANINIAEVRAKAQHLKNLKGLDLLIVDYIQLIKPLSPNRSREQEVAEASRGLKNLAKELKIPILGLAQLNRSTELRAGKVPDLADLRESGQLEQDADIVLLLHRKLNSEESEDDNKALMIVAKHRNGPLARIPLSFAKEYARFEEPIDQEEIEF